MNCSVCAECARPPTAHKVAARDESDLEFNSDGYMDDLEVVLSGGTRVMCKAIIDERTALGILVAMNARRNTSAEETVRVIEEHWISWAGPPKRLYYDSSRGHQSDMVEAMARRHGIKLECVPGEAWRQKGKVEKRIKLYKHQFVKLNHEVNLTAADPPSMWTSRLSWVANTQLRVEGFSPHQAVFGRDLRIPTDLLSDDASLPALSAALGPAGRAEQIRQAALRTFSELGDISAIRRAATAPQSTQRVPVKGDLVCWWRTQGTNRTSKRLQLAHGWHGPALVIGTEGTTKVYLSYRGMPLLVAPDQCRAPSNDEVELFEWMAFEAEQGDLLDKFRRYNTQSGFIDERGPAPS